MPFWNIGTRTYPVPEQASFHASGPDCNQSTLAVLGRLCHPMPVMTLSTQGLIGLGLGIFTGVFIGKMAAPLDVVGTGFARLLQMTVLP